MGKVVVTALVLLLPLGARAESAVGRVVDEQGRPIAGAWVGFRSQEPETARVKANSRGVFEIPDPPVDGQELLAWTPEGRLIGTLPVKPGFHLILPETCSTDPTVGGCADLLRVQAECQSSEATRPPLCYRYYDPNGGRESWLSSFLARLARTGWEGFNGMRAAPTAVPVPANGAAATSGPSDVGVTR